MDTAGTNRRRGDADPDPLRTLLLALLDQVEHFATTVVDGRGRDGDGGDGSDGGGDDRQRADLGPAVQAAVDAVLAEIVEVVQRLVTALIAALQAVSAALADLSAGRREGAPRSPDRHRPTARPAGSYRPIAVEVHPR